jgi:hypothetical protein
MEFQKWLKERGFVDRILAPEEFYDPSFVDAAAAALGPTTREAPAPP